MKKAKVKEYKVIQKIGINSLEKVMNRCAKEGWQGSRLIEKEQYYHLIMEKEVKK